MKVAVCNLQSEDFEKTLLNSLINTGFAVLTHHDIDYGLIKDAQSAWRKFFKRDQIYKNLFINGNDSNMGYKSFGSETAVGSKTADLKEFFHWKFGEEIPEGLYLINRDMFFELSSLGMKILRVLDDANGTNYEDDCEGSTKTLLRTLYYPALQNSDRQEGSVRAAAHEDINHITLLVAASAPGLEVLDNNGKWHAVPHEENSVIVNVGDMLKLASKGLYKSTTHRVVNPKDDASDRISMPFFIHPHGNVELSPGYTAGQFLEERIAQIYGKK
jgi:isopenicillin N synthase-like dioxygenase